MSEVIYPSEYFQKILAAEAPGGEAKTVQLIAPTVVAVGEEFDLKVAVADEWGYPSVEFDGHLVLLNDACEPRVAKVFFKRGQPAVALVRGFHLSQEGLSRFETRLRGMAHHSNPVSCQRAPSRRIYWGDPHVHTVLSQCHPDRCRSIQFAFTAGRWFAGLDWMSAADHVSNGRCELARWKEEVAAGNAHDDPPHFVTLPAYEASFKGGAGGDCNFYMRRWPDLFVEGYEDGTVKTACERLGEKLNPAEEFITVAHHTTRTGKHGEIRPDIYPGPEVMPVVEIHSKWGTSEYRGNPNPLKKIHEGPSYAVDLLNSGLPLGFIGGTDTHSTMPAGFGDDHLDRLPGMTAVLAPELTRDAIYDGIRSRNCYAASHERIYLQVDIAGASPGEQISTGKTKGERVIRALAAGRSDVEAIEIVRNGETIHRHEVSDWRGEVEFTDRDDLAPLAKNSPHLGRFVYYYVRVTCRSGAQAWSSPVWIIL